MSIRNLLTQSMLVVTTILATTLAASAHEPQTSSYGRQQYSGQISNYQEMRGLNPQPEPPGSYRMNSNRGGMSYRMNRSAQYGFSSRQSFRSGGHGGGHDGDHGGGYDGDHGHGGGHDGDHGGGMGFGPPPCAGHGSGIRIQSNRLGFGITINF